VLVIAVLFPMTEQAPVRLGAVMIAVALALAVGTLLLGSRVRRTVLLGEAALAVVLNSVLVAFAHTPGGAVGDAIAYGWLMVYVALFFPSATTAFAALVAAGFGVGLLVSGLPGMATPWAVVAVTTWTVGVVVSRVSRLIHLDTLTGTLNRRGLDVAAERASLRAQRRDEVLTVAALDLDAFKAINDRDGHAAGDRLLSETATAWRGVLRSEDLLARTGGDEFVLIMPRTSREEAAAVLDRLRRSHPVTWSAGIAAWRPGEPLAACLERADERLYGAKAARPAR
jgi:diguanylate cyclase (GGDEF)-like protein